MPVKIAAVATRWRSLACSPRRLGDAGQLAAVSHLADADAAQAELAVHRLRPPAALAPGVGAHRELRLPGRLEDKRLLGHMNQFSLNGNPRCLSSALPSSSVFAVVTIVMSIPRTRSMRSWSTSWKTDCSVRPKV